MRPNDIFHEAPEVAACGHWGGDRGVPGDRIPGDEGPRDSLSGHCSGAYSNPEQAAHRARLSPHRLCAQHPFMPPPPQARPGRSRLGGPGPSTDPSLSVSLGDPSSVSPV